ncbi:hypothetical protein BaRGS_00032192, partial [Batillaria attramentaria]
MASQSATEAPGGGKKCSSVPETGHADEWPDIIRRHWELLTTTLRASNLIFKMRLPPDCNEVERAMKLDMEDRCTEAAKEFLNYLLAPAETRTEADRTAQWSLFNQVLKSDYAWLRDIILDVSITDEELVLQKQLINFFRPEICEKVDPMHLLPHLISYEAESIPVACSSGGATNDFSNSSEDGNKRESLTGKELPNKNVRDIGGADNSNAELERLGDPDRVGGSGTTLSEGGKVVRKVVFLVNQVALAAQQYKQCEKYLKPFRCQLVSGDQNNATKVPLPHLLMRYFWWCLMNATTLVVGHPFNCIMHHYMAAKFPPPETEDHDRQLPQVVGLTASVGVGKAGDQEAAMKHIRKLCAHLDAEYICTVNRNAQQLAIFSNDPLYDLQTVHQRPDDQFQKKVEEIMKKIEEMMEKSEHTERIDADTGIKEKLKSPSRRGVDQYTIWFYNTSIGINDECDTEDALNYLKKQFEQLYENVSGRAIEIDIILKDLFDKNRPYLESVSKAQANTNPKLNKLEEMLFRAFTEEPESRAMIFVKTRDLAAALQQWMLRRPKLRQLKPGKIVGAGPSTEKGGMTKNQQVDVMTYFRQGDHKVMVATSVAEEGLDISKCNLVIRYNHVTNEIAMVQARAQRNGRQLREGEVILRCRTCDTYACMSSDIKTVERSHHVIVDLDFRDRSIEKPHPKPGLY